MVPYSVYEQTEREPPGGNRSGSQFMLCQ